MSEDKTKNDSEFKVLDGEESLLLDHDYDGIRELNYPLPSWWSWTWGASIVFGVLYFIYYVLAGGTGLRDELAVNMEKINEVRAEQAKLLDNFSIAEYNSWHAQNPGSSKGLEVFTENCVACHLEGGAGDIGPNLTDNYWLNVSVPNPENIFTFVRHGNEEKGMPAWGELLTKEDLYAVVKYVLDLQGTNPPNPKEPQGIEYKPE